MKLPNADRAVVDLAKLIYYCLNPEHPRGQHKARVFAAALGLTADHAEELRATILEAAVTYEAIPTERDAYGQRYVVDFVMTGPSGRARVRSTWIIRRTEDYLRLTTCYVL